MESANQPSRTEVDLDHEALACRNLAGWIGDLSSAAPRLSYTSLLLALLHAPNPLSRWLFRYARAAGVQLEKIYESFEVTPEQIRQAVARSGEPPSSQATQYTTSADSVLENAARLAREASRERPLGVRDMLASCLYNHDHRDQLIGWGFDPSRDGAAFVRQMRQRHAEELTSWTAFHQQMVGDAPDLEGNDPISPSPITEFAADTTMGTDLLGIDDDVYALSALICSKRMSPPLSIGLFGDWGSGKSFFMKQIQKGVRYISAEARGSGRMQKDVPFYKNIVQVEFNAWNYSEGNLWAALVQHLLDNLRVSEEEDDDLLAQRRAALKQQMDLDEQALRVARDRETEAKSALVNTEQELKALRTAHNAEIDELQQVLARDVLAQVHLDDKTVEGFAELRKSMGMDQVGHAAGELLSAIDATRAVLRSSTALFTRLPQEQRGRFVVMSALVILAPPVAAVVVGLALRSFGSNVAPVAAAAAWLSATLSGGAAWLRERAGVLGKHLATLETLQAQVEQRVNAKRKQNEADAARLEQHITLKKDEILAAQAKQNEAANRLQQVAAELKATTPGRVLADFIRTRSQSEDYRRHLGLLAVIRRDFERISDTIDAENRSLEAMTEASQEKIGQEHRINRIVLYIDDLDRCPEDRVVDVLKAVHLLLAFPLFVVVVGVDARWISKSLASRFPGLLAPVQGAGNGEELVGAPADIASSLDYLEKIFQIPVWLKPPSEDGVRNMLAELVRDGQGPGKSAASGARAKDLPLAETSREKPVFQGHPHDPNALVLEIRQAEAEFIDKLVPLVGRSPRSLKRFVNVYRLLKASLPPEESAVFVDEANPAGPSYRAVLLLMALIHEQSSLGHRVLERIFEARRNRSNQPTALPTTLGQLIDSTEVDDESRRVVTWMTVQHGADWATRDASALLDWAPSVARYSYRIQRS